MNKIANKLYSESMQVVFDESCIFSELINLAGTEKAASAYLQKVTRVERSFIDDVVNNMLCQIDNLKVQPNEN